MIKQLYICYSRDDREEVGKVTTIVEKLKEFLDGANIVMTEEPVFESIDDSSAVLCILTSSFASSNDVADELKYSSNLNKTILGLFATSVDSLDDIFGKFKHKDIKDSIRSGFFKWYPLAEQNIFVRQLISTLGLDSPIADAVGALVTVSVDTKHGFSYQIDEFQGSFPAGTKFSFRLMPGSHMLSVNSLKSDLGCFRESLEISNISETFNRYFDMDTLLDEIGYDGTVIDDSGNSYTGWIARGLFDGAGVYTTHDGYVYDGVFKEGKIMSGLLKEPNGDQYSGQFKNWKRHGEGKQMWRDSGEMYEGTWDNGIMCGHGMFVSNDTSIYEGEFKDGVLYEGTVTYSNGKQFSVYNKKLKLDNGFVFLKDRTFMKGLSGNTMIIDHVEPFIDEPQIEEASVEEPEVYRNFPISAICKDEYDLTIYFIEGKFYKDELGNSTYSGVANCKWEDEGIVLKVQVQDGIITKGVFYMDDNTPIVEGRFENNFFEPEEEHFPLWRDFLQTVFEDFHVCVSDEQVSDQYGLTDDTVLIEIPEEPEVILPIKPIEHKPEVIKKTAPVVSSNSIKYSDGSVYYGHIYGNLRQGEGRIVYANEDVFDGSWDNDKYDGKGTYRWASEEIVFKGTFKNDNPIEGCYFMDGDMPIVSGHWNNGEFEPLEEYFPNWSEFIQDLVFEHVS